MELSESDCRTLSSASRKWASLKWLPAFAITLLAGCSINLPGTEPPPGTCPAIAEFCPDLACDVYEQNADGCDICSCAQEAQPVVCWDAGDCSDGQVCDTDNYCETPPGCQEGQACPAVCYGRCAEPTPACQGDAECSDGERCLFVNGGPTTTSPAPDGAPADAYPCMEGDPNCGGAVPPADDPALASGVCVPSSCDGGFEAYPCPPGTRPVVDFDANDCGQQKCVPVSDDCRNLDIAICGNSEGCMVVDVPDACDCGNGGAAPRQGPGGNADPVDCGCTGSGQVCAPAGDACRDLGEDACAMNPECEGYFTDGCVAVPCDCDPANGETCACPDACAQEFVCAPHQRPPEGCLDDRDCFNGERCERYGSCVDDCYVTQDGTTECFSDCFEEGVCVAGEASCFDLYGPDCEADPRCQLADYGSVETMPCACPDTDPNCDCGAPAQRPAPYCEPIPPTNCQADSECGVNEHCEIQDYCPPCGGGGGGGAPDQPDYGCGAPCWSEGVCVGGTAPPPDACDANGACAPGSECVVTTICEDCGFGGGGGTGGAPDAGAPQPAPPQCDPICYDDAICVPTEPEICYGDFDCADGRFCELFADCVGGPTGLVACAGSCQNLPVQIDYCLSDADCATGSRCPTETDVCLNDPSSNLAVCYWACEEIPVPPPAPNICLSDADCQATDRCATELNDCLCRDPACDVCYSQCVPRDPPVCADVISYAMNPQTGVCEEFPDSCTPADWTACDPATTAPPTDGGPAPDGGPGAP